ncbi:MAG: N-glycosylase/DNA lyase [Vulcanisaeta sp.]
MTNDIKSNIASTLRDLGIGWVRSFEENDPQYVAIGNLCSEIKDEEVALKLTIMNALISYQLSGKGEDHWDYFANYFIKNKPKNLCNDFINYIISSKYLVRYRDSRIKRINNVCPKIINLKLTNYLSNNDLSALWTTLAKILNASGDEKTIVFAVKMAYYLGRACGHDINVPMDIPIPVDYRVTVITICSGLLPIVGISVNAKGIAKEIMVRRRKEIQGIWNEIGRLSGIPPLNLDSVIWVLGGLLINSSFSINNAIRKSVDLGIDMNDKVIRLLHLLGGRCIVE